MKYLPSVYFLALFDVGGWCSASSLMMTSMMTSLMSLIFDDDINDNFDDEFFYDDINDFIADDGTSYSYYDTSTINN